MSEVVTGKFHKADGTFDVALAVPEPANDPKGGLKVTVFPEPGSQFEVHHNVPTGTAAGEFSV